jgi:hypothetical protein
MCQHQPRCPSADASDHDAARVVVAHPEQGWVRLCNGIIRFDDNGELVISVLDHHRSGNAGTRREANLASRSPT